MSYKPKFCCQCGETVETIDWKPWMSGRFCELCATEFGIYDKLPLVVFGIGLLFGLFGIGTYLQKPEKQLNVAPNQFIGATVLKSENANPKISPSGLPNNSAPSSAQTANQALPLKSQIALPVSDLRTKQIQLASTEPAEKVYFCGAATKKGTMCSRRVKGGGRCWQHAGQEAMVSQEKLLASN